MCGQRSWTAKNVVADADDADPAAVDVDDAAARRGGPRRRSPTSMLHPDSPRRRLCAMAKRFAMHDSDASGVAAATLVARRHGVTDDRPARSPDAGHRGRAGYELVDCDVHPIMKRRDGRPQAVPVRGRASTGSGSTAGAASTDGRAARGGLDPAQPAVRQPGRRPARRRPRARRVGPGRRPGVHRPAPARRPRHRPGRADRRRGARPRRDARPRRRRHHRLGVQRLAGRDLARRPTTATAARSSSARRTRSWPRRRSAAAGADERFVAVLLPLPTS